MSGCRLTLLTSLALVAACGTAELSAESAEVPDAGADAGTPPSDSGQVVQNPCGTCPEGQVCSAGSCQKDCTPGTTACSDVCIDTQKSNQHCGACGKACDVSEYCNAGSCIRSGCS